jgi:GNAT superfamily N-acetyltransferase
MITIWLMTGGEGIAAARLHRRAGALVPGYDTLLHSEAEFVAFYRDRVMVDGPVWGAFENNFLRGHVAMLPGWIEPLYVDPDFHGCGIGSALLRFAQSEKTNSGSIPSSPMFEHEHSTSDTASWSKSSPTANETKRRCRT